MTVPAMADRDLQARSWTAGLCGCWRCAIKCSPPRSAPRRDREPRAGRAAPAWIWSARAVSRTAIAG